MGQKREYSRHLVIGKGFFLHRGTSGNTITIEARPACPPLCGKASAKGIE